MHYVCQECGGVSHKEKSCGTEGCSLNGQPLTACACTDPAHLAKVKESEEREKSQVQDVSQSVQSPTS